MNHTITFVGFQLTVLLSTLLLQACVIVTYIKPNDINNELKKYNSSIRSAQTKIQKQNKINASLFEQFTERGQNLTVSPYPKLLLLHKAMLKIEKDYRINAVKLSALTNEFNTATQGQSRIKDDSPKWQQIMAIYKQYQQSSDGIKNTSTEYKTQIEQFMSIANNNDIYLMEVADINNQMKTYKKQIEDRSIKIQQFINETNTKISGKYRKSLSNSQRSKINKLKIQINELSTYFISMKKHIEQLLLEFNHEVKARTHIWTVADMKVRTMFTEMEKENKIINSKIDNVRASWNSI